MQSKYIAAQYNDWDSVYDSISITKSDVREYVRTRLSISDPDSLNLLTDKLIIRTLFWAEGYKEGVKLSMEPPINPNDVKRFILSECFSYICRKIEENGKKRENRKQKISKGPRRSR